MSKRNYNIDVQVYTKNQNVISNCNAITFINPASSGVDFTVNNIPVTSGSELEISGLEDETDVTPYVINFGTNNGTCIVVKKVYV